VPTVRFSEAEPVPAIDALLSKRTAANEDVAGNRRGSGS
jgi:hypothetical protein